MNGEPDPAPNVKGADLYGFFRSRWVAQAFLVGTFQDTIALNPTLCNLAAACAVWVCLPAYRSGTRRVSNAQFR